MYGIDTLSEYASYFGLGQKTGIELLSESSGTVASKEVAENSGNGWYVADTLSAAIGQSYNSFTPVQMAKYVSMLANGGNDIDVTIIKSIINADGTEVSTDEISEYVNEKLGLEETEETSVTISSENLETVLEGMHAVTESGGTAYSTFKNFDIEVGGKTGSAQTGDDSAAHAWFVCFAPFDDPEIAIAVLVEHGGSGGYTAPVAKAIMEEYFGMNSENVDEDTEAISSKEEAN